MILYGTDSLTDRRQAYSLLALAAAEHWSFSELPPMQRKPRGKPYFTGLNGYEFNLSHSGTLALCALDSTPVGVDIQTIKARRPGLLPRVCSAQELSWLEQGDELWSRFTQLWALKECRVKYSGTGLIRPISEIQVPLFQNQETLSFLDGMWFRIYEGAGWRGAVCGLTPPPEAIRWVIL